MSASGAASGAAAGHVTGGGGPRDPIAQQWICESCGLIYDPAEGDPDGGIPPGTAFEDIPDTWMCPVCGARKRDFVPYD